MCTDAQVKAELSLLSNVVYILACTSTYPSVDEEINLRYISTLSQQYPDLRIGFSNHYSGHDASTGAIALGASLLEFHITSDRTMYGSDQAASIEDAQGLIHGIRSMEIMLGDGKKQVYEKEKSIIKKLRKVDDSTQ